MQLSELIKELQYNLDENGDMEVMTSSNYGDYHNTEQLDDIMEITLCVPVESAYSHSGLAYPSDMDQDDDEPNDESDEDDHDNKYFEDIARKEQVLVLRYTNR